MRKFLGLKFISALYKIIALLTAIIAIVWAALIIGDSVLTTRSVRISLNGDWSWFQQTFTVLVVGGLLSLTFFVIAEIIDAILANYEVSRTMLEQLNRSNDTNERMIKAQIRLLKSVEPQQTPNVSQQIATRKTTIKVDEDDIFGNIS